MLPLFPSQTALKAAFGQNPAIKAQENASTPLRTPRQARTDRFSAWSIADDAQGKAVELSDAAKRELRRASEAAQENVGKIELYSSKFYATAVFGGLMACGATHWMVTPLDLVKCRRQVNSTLYAGNFDGWRKIISSEGGIRGIFTGGGPTAIGYSIQGALKYGGYEYFKKLYSDLAGPENAERYKTWIYLAGSASAEVIADIGLCPLEAVKIRMQTSLPPFAKGTVDGITKITAKEGVAGLYKGLYPLWGRQIPYTMMKFASFETVVEMIYHRLPGSKAEYSKTAQTGVAFTGGYIAGILCAVISHPADVMVSKLNASRAPGEAFGKAMSRIYKDIGFGGLWNGLPVRIVMVGTLTGLQWMIYDSFKIYMGFPSTGGSSKPVPEIKA